jgi:hypothetical protein
MGLRIDQKEKIVEWFSKTIDMLNFSHVDGDEILTPEKEERNTRDMVRLLKKMAINHPSIGVEISKFEITAPAGLKNFTEGKIYKVRILPILKGINGLDAHEFLLRKRNIIMAGEEGIDFVLNFKRDLLPSKLLFSFEREKVLDENGHLLVPSVACYQDNSVQHLLNNHPLVAEFDCILCFSEKRVRK